MRIGIEFGFDATSIPGIDRLALEALIQVLRARVENVAEVVRQTWIERAQDLGISRTGDYVRGIHDARVDVLVDRESSTDLSVSIALVNTAPHARIVEDGHAAFHLPSAMSWNTDKVKRTKDGRPYLHIPFRHAAFQDEAQRAASGMTRGTLKAMMPKGIYASAKGMSYTSRRGVGPVFAGGAEGQAFKQSDLYTHGPGRRRLEHQAPAGLVALPSGDLYEFRRNARSVGRINGREAINPAWGSSRHDGMIKGGSPGATEYTTIRTITIDSPGWNIPAQVGYGVTRQVASYFRTPQGRAALEETFAGPIADVLRSRS